MKKWRQSRVLSAQSLNGVLLALVCSATLLLQRAAVRADGDSSSSESTGPAAVAELTGDKVPDHVYAVPSGGPNVAGIVTIHSGGSEVAGTTIVGEAAADGFGASVSAMFDLNLDAAIDLIVGAPNLNGGRIYVFFGSFVGNGETISAADADLIIESPDKEAIGFGQVVAATPDVDGDGMADIVVRASIGSEGGVRVYALSSASLLVISSQDSGGGEGGIAGGLPPCFGDITGLNNLPDGYVNIDDLLAVVGAWGSCPTPPTLCPADIAPQGNPDAAVNIDDLLAVIAQWGACDYDGDGMPDAWELLYGLDPNTSGPEGDADNDGIADLQEFLLGIIPINTSPS